MPARRKRAGKALSAAKGAAAKLVDLCLDMEDPLNEALDAAHALRLIGYALREVGNERDARRSLDRLVRVPEAPSAAAEVARPVQGDRAGGVVLGRELINSKRPVFGGKRTVWSWERRC